MLCCVPVQQLQLHVKLISPDLLHSLTDMKLEKPVCFSRKHQGRKLQLDSEGTGTAESGKSKQTHKKAKELGVCWGSVGCIRHFSHLEFTNLFETREQAK